MKASTFTTTRGGLLLFFALVAGFMLAIGFSVWAATTISTNVVTDGHVKATSTVQATGSVLAYGDLLVGGSTTAAVTGLNVGGVTGTAASAFITGGLGVENATTTTGHFLVGNDFTVFSNGRVAVGATTSPVVAGPSLSIGGAAGTHADVYISGGLGVANATTSDGDFVVGDDFFVYSNGRIGIATSSPGTPEIGLAASTTETHFASGGTSTVKIYSNDVTANAGKGGCIEMNDSAGTIYKIFITHGSTTLLGVESGSCR